MKRYKVIKVRESGLSSLLLGSGKLPMEKLEADLNDWATKGWRLAFMVIEQERHLLFWTREAAIVTFERSPRTAYDNT